MNRPLILLAFLSLAALLLAIFDPWQHSPKVADPRLVPASLLASLTAIEYRDLAQMHVAERHAGGGWQSVLPKEGAADEHSVAQLVSALEFARVVRSAKLRGVHGVQQGAPRLTLTTGTGKTLEIFFGATDGQHQWVRLGQAEEALLIEAHVVADMRRSATSLRSTRLIPWTLSAAAPFRLTMGSRWVQFNGGTVQWSEEGSLVSEGDADSTKQRELLQAFQELHVATEPCEYAIEFLLEQNDDAILVSAANCVTSGPWKIVRSAIDNPELFVRLNVLPSSVPNSDISIQCGKRRVEVRLEEADPTAFSRWWRRVDTLGRNLVPERELKIECVLAGSDWRVELGTLGDAWYARLPHYTNLLRLAPEARSLIRVGPEVFLSPLLIEEEAVFARRIEIRDGKHVRILERGETADSWSEVGAKTNHENASTLATTMATALGMLQAERFGTQGNATGRRRIIVVFDGVLGESQVRHSLELRGTPGNCTVTVDKKPWAELSPKTCAALWAE